MAEITLHIYKIFFYLCLLICNCVGSLPTPKYGEFDLQIDKFNICQGPKRKDCSVISTKMLNKTSIDFSMKVSKDVKPTKVKITAMSNGKLLVRLQADDPCNHLFLRPLLQRLYNASDKCVVSKGSYHFVVDLEEIAKTYYAGSFIYGNITFKAIFYNNECNLSCAVTTVTFLPKEKPK